MEKKIRIQVRTLIPFVILVSALLLQPGVHVKANSTAYTNELRFGSAVPTLAFHGEAPEIRDTTGSKKGTMAKRGCSKSGCGVYAEIDKSEQMMYVYVEGDLQHSFPVSTGKRGHETPNLDLRPTGPVYEKYRSRKYPEGDYKGMGNMPYAVFIKGGYAIHGTTPGSFSKLGKKASHGCVRLHPDDARQFYELVNTMGLENTWVTIKP